VPEAARPELIEAMAAHEIAHCWRYVQGAWHALPAGFVEVGDEASGDGALLEAAKHMRETRREEGFADLAALAWTRLNNPSGYERVYGWLERVRGQVSVDKSGHDTRVCVRLAKDGERLAGGATPFESANGLWREGLLNDD